MSTDLLEQFAPLLWNLLLGTFFVGVYAAIAIRIVKLRIWIPTLKLFTFAFLVTLASMLLELLTKNIFKSIAIPLLISTPTAILFFLHRITELVVSYFLALYYWRLEMKLAIRFSLIFIGIELIVLIGVTLLSLLQYLK